MPDDTPYEAWDLEALSNIPNYQEWIISAFRPYLSGEAAEIGAGTGTFSLRLLEHVDRLDLVEPASNMVSELQRKFAGNADITIISRTIEDYLDTAPLASMDSVVLVNVMEHIKDDIRALSGLYGILRPGGHLLIFVPALGWLFSAMDVALGHFRRYRRGRFRNMVRSAGFEVVSARYFDILGVVPWWIVHTVGGRTRFSPRLSKLYDRLAVPVGRALEAKVPLPLGKNILLIARKPETPGSPRPEARSR